MESNFLNLDLFSVGVVVAAILLLGFVLYFNQRNNLTNKIFLWFCIFTSIWSVANYVSYKVTISQYAIWVLRGEIFFAVWLVYTLYLFLKTFPDLPLDKSAFKKTLLSAFIVSGLTLTPYVFSYIETFYPNGTPNTIHSGIAIPLFGVFVFSYLILGLISLAKKIKHSVDDKKAGLFNILFGIITTFALLLIFIFVYPAFFHNSKYIYLGAVFVFPLVFSLSIAIFKQRLVSVKVVSTEILVLILSLASLVEVVVSQDGYLLLLRFFIFLLILSTGVLLVRSVFNEVRQREQLEVLTKELAAANDKLKELDKARAEFISIASHQLRTPPATIKWYLAAIRSGDYGKMDQEVNDALEKAEVTNNAQISLIDDLLNASRIERGKMEFFFEEDDVVNLTKLAFDQLLPQAKMKKLEMVFNAPKQIIPKIVLDKEKVRQVVNNFIDNAIKYTQHGKVTVDIFLENDCVKIQVSDNGKGIAPNQAPYLFEKYNRGKDSVMHATGLGLGLYVAKVIIEKHNGKIWAESDGEGKGSRFIFTLPVHSVIEAGTGGTLDLTQMQGEHK